MERDSFDDKPSKAQRARHSVSSSQTLVPAPMGCAEGILSQTLIPSPSVRWILPGRLRSPNHNDVVFVGENFIQLREFHYNGPLADVTAKINVGYHILAAKILSADTVPVPFMEQVKEQNMEDERFVINGKPVDNDMPPQILLVTLSTGDLLFLYAKTYSPGDVRFQYGKMYVSREMLIYDSRGGQIAVEPRYDACPSDRCALTNLHRSRAIAIASATRVAILVPKAIDEIKADIDMFSEMRLRYFHPVTEVRSFHSPTAQH